MVWRVIQGCLGLESAIGGLMWVRRPACGTGALARRARPGEGWVRGSAGRRGTVIDERSSIYPRRRSSPLGGLESATKPLVREGRKHRTALWDTGIGVHVEDPHGGVRPRCLAGLADGLAEPPATGLGGLVEQACLVV